MMTKLYKHKGPSKSLMWQLCTNYSYIKTPLLLEQILSTFSMQHCSWDMAVSEKMDHLRRAYTLSGKNRQPIRETIRKY